MSGTPTKVVRNRSPNVNNECRICRENLSNTKCSLKISSSCLGGKRARVFYFSKHAMKLVSIWKEAKKYQNESAVHAEGKLELHTRQLRTKLEVSDDRRDEQTRCKRSLPRTVTPERSSSKLNRDSSIKSSKQLFM